MKLTTILIAIMLFGIKIFAQIPAEIKDDKVRNKKPVYVKTIDFLGDSRNLRDDTVKNNRKYSYILKNINKFVYKETTAEQKGENLNTERPEILKGIKLPAFFNTDKIGPTRDIASEEESLDKCKCEDVEKIIGRDKDLREAYRRLTDNNKKVIELTKLFNTNIGITRYLTQLKENIILPWPDIKVAKMKLISDSISIPIDSVDRDNLLTKFYTNIPERLLKILEESIKPDANTLAKALRNRILFNSECLFDYQRGMRCLDSCKSKSYIQEEDRFLRLKLCIEKEQEFLNSIRSDISEIESGIEAINKSINDGAIRNLQTNYNLLVIENFELELEAFTADKDVHEITFTAKAESPLVFGKPVTRTIKINAVTYGGLKIDYSAGAFLNWGSNRFLGPEYYFENPTDSTKIIREAGRIKKGLLSIGALMHVSYRINFFLRPAVSVGVSTTSGFDALNFHGGVSLILGRPGRVNRVILTYGFTWREVDLLNSRYFLDVERKDYPDAVPTSKNFPIRGQFFSLTYNLRGINK